MNCCPVHRTKVSCKRVCSDCRKEPTSIPSTRTGRSTIEKWYYRAKGAPDPISALGRKIRSDAGIRWSMSDALLATLKTQYETHRRWNVQLHYDNLVALAQERKELKPIPSYKTVLRCMRDNGWFRTHEPANPSRGQRMAAQRLERISAGATVRSRPHLCSACLTVPMCLDRHRTANFYA